MLYKIYLTILGRPLFFLLQNGPMLQGQLFRFGFYGGKTTAEICEDTTSVSKLYWATENKQCNEIIQKKIDSFVILFFSLFYFYYVISLFSFCVANIPRLIWRNLIKVYSNLATSIFVKSKLPTFFLVEKTNRTQAKQLFVRNLNSVVTKRPLKKRSRDSFSPPLA